MFRVPSLGRVRLVRNVAVSIVLLSVVITGLPAAGALSVSPTAAAPLSAPVSAGHTAAPAPHALATSHSSPSTPSSPSRPLGTGNSSAITFYSNNSTLAPKNVTKGGSCAFSSYLGGAYNYYYADCYGGSIDPTLVNLANGNVGVGYSYATSKSVPGSACSAASGNASALVAFSVSANNGSNWGAPNVLGNLSCSFYNAIEPSFTAAPNGNVYGVYVEENYSGPQGQYTSRAADALGFTVSTNNGVTFSAPISINTSGNIARPQIVSYGKSLYVLFENISASTSTYLYYGLGSYGAHPISLNLLYSANDGASWSGPYLIPGENSTADNSSMGGWLQVNSTGTVGLSYFTNHSCVYIMYAYCYRYGDNLVFATSTTNGSSWNTPSLVASDLGETYLFSPYYLTGYFQYAPQSQFVFGSTGTQVYIAYTASYSKNTATYWYYNYEYSGVFEATGTVTGSVWSLHVIQATMDYFNYDNTYHPAIGWAGGTLYLAFSWENTTYCYSSCAPQQYTLSEWAATSTDGVTWTSASLVDVINMRAIYYYCSYYCGDDFEGFQASVASTTAGLPLFGFSLSTSYEYTSQHTYNGTAYNYYFNYTYSARLEVAFVYTGPSVTVNFTEQNLPIGTQWSFRVNGETITTTSASYYITDIPVNVSVSVTPNSVPAGFWTIISPGSSVGNEVQFSKNSTVWFNYSVSYGMSLAIQPPNVYYADLYITYNGSYYYYYVSNCIGCTPYSSASPSFPWYFPKGALINIQDYGYPIYPSYWTGTGPGSYNGSGIYANLTMNGVVNETVWYGGFGSYNVIVNPVGLPSTSTYSFAFSGTNYSAGGTTSVTIPNVETGAYSVTHIQANSSTAGWEYFGYSTPANPIVVPVEPIVNLSFAYVDVAAAPGTVTFQAVGLTAGTVWTFEFNGTTYSSDTPWINVTTRPGTFPVQGFPVTSQNSSIGYVPTGLSATMSVTTGSTYPISYNQAYKVQVLVGTGGTVSGAGTYWAATGAVESFHAAPKSNYEFGGWSGTGTGSYTGLSGYANFTVGGPIVETANFYPLPTDRFNLTVTETGLGNGTWYTVFLGGSGYSSNLSSFLIQNLYPCGVSSGNYNVSVPYAYSFDGLTRYVVTSRLPTTICTSGSTLLSVTFAPEYFLTLQATPGGYAEASVGLVTTTTGLWVPSTLSVQLTAIALSGYTFVTWNGTGPGAWNQPGSSQSIVLSGPVTETAVFAKIIAPVPARYTLDLKAQSALAPGTSWSATVGGTTYSSTSGDLYIPNLLAGSYPLSIATSLSPDGLTRYVPIGNPTSVAVTHNQTLAISFQTYYEVSVVATAGGQIGTPSGWVTSGGSVLLNATPSTGYTFVGWSGTGAASYSGSNAVTTLHVTSPVSEVALFQQAAAQKVSTGSQSTSFWGQTSTWILFAIVGLVVGLAVGLVLTRRRAPPAAPVEMEPAAGGAEPSTEGA